MPVYLCLASQTIVLEHSHHRLFSQNPNCEFYDLSPLSSSPQLLCCYRDADSCSKPVSTLSKMRERAGHHPFNHQTRYLVHPGKCNPQDISHLNARPVENYISRSVSSTSTTGEINGGRGREEILLVGMLLTGRNTSTAKQ